MNAKDLARFMSKTERTEAGCLEWTAGLGRGGYGKFKAEGRTAPAHVWIWEHFNGPLLAENDVHHTCRNRKCVERSHIVQRTRAEHRALHTADRTHCRRGHPYSEENTTWRQKKGEAPYRVCKECERLRGRQWYEDNREKAIAKSAAFLKAHPELNREHVHKAYRKNPEATKARVRAYVLAHPEKVREWRRNAAQRRKAQLMSGQMSGGA